MPSIQILFFRIWYSSAFVVLFLIALVLTLVSPADLIYQSIRNHSFPNVFSVAAVYLVTALVCVFLWASRIYSNRAVLRDIPKHYVPIEAADLPRKVRRLIVRQLRRSNLVAWESRPRDLSLELRAAEAVADGEHAEGQRRGAQRRFHRGSVDTHNAHELIPAAIALKAWGDIQHPGWAALQSSQDERAVEYWSVIVELPNLLEAKAVSLAPVIPSPQEGDEGDAGPDARWLALLRRPDGVGLREYVTNLIALGVFTQPAVGERFVKEYEYARFSTMPLTVKQFEQLMALFASLLSGLALDLSRFPDLHPDHQILDSSSHIYTYTSESDSAYNHADNQPAVSDDDGSVRRHPHADGLSSYETSIFYSIPSETSSVIVHRQ